MSTEEHQQVATSRWGWIYAHIGRLLGISGGFLTLAILIFFATLGFRPALFIIVFAIAGVLLIFGGGKIHQA
jgi:hypothetical protein